MPADISVTTDPLLVFGMVGLLLGAVVLALIFARPRRGLGAVKRSDVSKDMPPGEPWMPGGDIFDGDGASSSPPPPVAGAPLAQSPSAGPPAAPDPWSSGAGATRGVPPPGRD
jgi:hypothetical protein